jgi:5-carboxymethyl-2-hydroxymuconate isomerase
MPHLIIEHNKEASSDFDLNLIAKTLHEKLSEFETISKSAIKTRTHKVDHVFIGADSTPNKFIHITLLLLKGRPQELKEKIIKALFDSATNLVSDCDYTITIENRDLETYFKI